MKELSIEEKAQRYDEAIEKAKEFKNNPFAGYDGTDLISSLFPELKESEDEKIRNEIIAFVEQSIHRGGGTPISEEQETKWIDWLEKQGKPIDKIVERAMNEKQRVLLTETNGDANIDWNTRSLQDVKLLLEYGLDYIKKLEKQGEQKPDTDFSDLRTWKYIVDAVLTKENGIGNYLNSARTEAIAKELQERFGKIEQGSAKWTHKDGKNLAELWEILSVHRNTNPQVDNLMEWVKGLVSYKRQEWSEEDENRINRLIAYFEDKESFTAEDDVVYANWLKSLKDRYVWKPTEEQMKAFEHFVRSVGESGYASPYDDDIKLIYSLLEQLKQL